MEPTRFDAITTHFARRRISRRDALAGASLATGAVAVGLTQAAQAQDATPAASPEPEVAPSPVTEQPPAQLFVQAFQSGSIASSTSEFGTHTVTLAQGMGQTIVFTDRPSREVFTAPTPAFLDGLGFDAANPPNAAILMDAGDGTTDIAVVELFNPSYDEATHTATYDVAVLANWQNELELGFQEEPADLSNVAAEFGATHLFIDGCYDGDVLCFAPGDNYSKGKFTDVYKTWWITDFQCFPVAPNVQNTSDIQRYWIGQCNTTFPACEGKCNQLIF